MMKEQCFLVRNEQILNFSKILWVPCPFTETFHQVPEGAQTTTVTELSPPYKEPEWVLRLREDL